MAVFMTRLVQPVSESGGIELVTGVFTSGSSRNYLNVYYSNGTPELQYAESSGNTETIQVLKNTIVVLVGDASRTLSGGISKTDGVYFVTGDFGINA